MSTLMRYLMSPYMAPAGDEGDTGGGGAPVDRGDNFKTDGSDDTSKATDKEAAKEGASKSKDDAKDKDDDEDEDEAAKKPAKDKDDDDEDEPKKKGTRIPKARFDEAVGKERAEKEALATQLKAYQDRDAKTKVADDFAEANRKVKEMIKQHSSLLADGELDKASDLMETILEVKEIISERKAAAHAASTKETTKDEVRYDAMVAKLEADHPEINPDSSDFDKEKVEEVQILMSGFMRVRQMSATQALKAAVERVFAVATKADKGEEAKDAGMRRKEAAVGKALDAKSKQPGNLKEVGKDHDKEGGPLDAAAVLKMSYEEFVKLPDSKLAELRGDHL